MNRVAVVVLNYRGIKDTISCVDSLIKQTYKEFKIVLVENGSQDDSANEFKKLKILYGERIHTLYNHKNLGFTGGVNTGIKWGLEQKYDSLVLFNNDAIADKNWLKHIVTASEKDKKVGITTGLLLLKDGRTIDSTGDWFSIWGLPFPRNRNDKANEAPNTDEYIFGASGGASLYKASMLREIGIFDDDFFAYYEDADISFRAQLAGWKVLYTPKAIAYHQQGATSARMPGDFTVFQTFKNLPLLFTKNVPRGLLWSIGTRFWFAYFIMLGHAIARGRGKAAVSGYFRGIILFWKVALPARRVIQSNKRVDTHYIKELLWPDLPPDQTGLRKLRHFFTRR